jgi:hypothetical protein
VFDAGPARPGTFGDKTFVNEGWGTRVFDDLPDPDADDDDGPDPADP